jgi:hypothetical protein
VYFLFIENMLGVIHSVWSSGRTRNWDELMKCDIAFLNGHPQATAIQVSRRQLREKGECSLGPSAGANQLVIGYELIGKSSRRHWHKNWGWRKGRSDLGGRPGYHGEKLGCTAQEGNAESMNDCNLVIGGINCASDREVVRRLEVIQAVNGLN